MNALRLESGATVAGVGIDVADVRRFERLIGRGGQRLWRHWFTPAETALCLTSGHPAEMAAARFAVKEATLKAIGTSFAGPVRWREIEIVGSEPIVEVHVHDEMAGLAQSAGINSFRVSTSNTGQHVIAIVIAQSSAVT